MSAVNTGGPAIVSYPHGKKRGLVLETLEPPDANRASRGLLPSPCMSAHACWVSARDACMAPHTPEDGGSHLRCLEM